MKILQRLLAFIPVLILSASSIRAQLYKVELDETVSNSTLIAEGKVIGKKSFWNDAHTMIFTTNTVEVYKIFKGNITEGTIEVMTQGGSVGPDAVEVSELLQLDIGKIGIFFCEPNRINLKSPFTQKILYDVYGSDQGFLRYDLENDEAYAPFASYKKIESNLYKVIEQKTGQSFRLVNGAFSIATIMAQKAAQSGQTVLATISSFSPATVHGGALNDPTNNALTINGSGFGTASGSAEVRFKDANSDNTTPDFSVPYSSSYLISWSDTKIVLKVPSRAATGKIAVVTSAGSSVQSTASLNISYSVLDAAFDFSPTVDTVVVAEPRLMNTNNNGGYTIKYSTSTAGQGKNFSTDPAKETFLRALATWKESIGVNFIVGSTTPVQQIDDDTNNLVVFDNLNTGVPPMASGILEVTYSFSSLCFVQSPFQVYTAQKRGFDVLIRNNGVSAGNISFEEGPCFPAIGSYDREMIILHELGHALNLAHINDDYQGLSAPDINPQKVMHYSIASYADRRSLDNSAYKGGFYTTTKQNNTYGSCGLFTSEMNPLSYIAISNDDCPLVFPTAPTTPGTVVNFDLVHATSNKFVDPQYTAVNGSNTGTQVTNNAYYAFKTSNTSNGTLTVSISGYVTTPTTVASCAGEGVRLAVYDVSSCPAGQIYPQPVTTRTFSTNGVLTDITGLQSNHTYLLYFDGLRNTKANFSATLNGTALPLTLANFTGEFINGKNQLYIDVLQAVNIENISIEKSYDGIRFSELGALPSSSNWMGKHSYTDAQPFAGNNYYRLKIVNNDGSFDYSNIILLKNDAKRLVYIYPNPVKDLLTINITSLNAGRYNCLLYDISGKLLSSSVHQVAEGAQTIAVPFSRIASGVYVVKVIDENGNVITRKNVIKQ